MSTPKTAKQSFQQGDVLGRRVDGIKIPIGSKKLASGERTMIMHGESGHSHVVTDDPEATFFQVGDMLLLKLTKTATLTHEEHKPITLEGPGIWEIGRVREFDYLSDKARYVVD